MVGCCGKLAIVVQSAVCTTIVLAATTLPGASSSAAEFGSDEKELVERWRKSHENMARFLAPECFDMASRLLEEGRKNLAARYFEFASRLYPDWSLPRLYLGMILVESDDSADVGKATRVLREAARVAPENPRVHKALSMALEKSGSYEEAIRELARAKDLRPAAFGDITEKMAELNLKAGNLKAAASAYESLYKQGRGGITVLAKLADIFEQMKDWRRAELYLRKLLSHNPDKVYAHYQLADFYRRKGDQKAARREIRKLKRLSRTKKKRRLRPLRPSRR